MKFKTQAMLIPLISLLVLSQHPAARIAQDPNDVGTFSILGYDEVTGEVGGAVQSRVFSVGNGVIWAEAGVGAVATQAILNVSYGPKGLELLRQGMAPKDIIKKLLADDTDETLGRQSWSKSG